VGLSLCSPWIWNALRAGYPPAGLFQWYYWDLGRALSHTHGIPSYVTEFGGHVRWLPDYLVFNIVSETYHGIARLGINAEQLSAFRISLALSASSWCTERALAPVWAPHRHRARIATVTFADKFSTFARVLRHHPQSHRRPPGVRGVRRL
jgi:hypothetical protein